MLQRSPYHGRRIRGIELPCPSCIPLSTKAASIIACAVMCIAYVVWSVVLWKVRAFRLLQGDGGKLFLHDEEKADRSLGMRRATRSSLT